MRFIRAVCRTAMLTVGLVAITPSYAIEAITVRPDAPAIDLTDTVERHHTETDRLLVWAAPGPGGIRKYMDVRAREESTNWAVFALANWGDEQIERLIVVPHDHALGSGVLWRELGVARIAGIASNGEPPERQESTSADIFRVTLDPGIVTTFVLELRTDKLDRFELWEPEAYKDRVDSVTLYHGIMIGIADLLRGSAVTERLVPRSGFEVPIGIAGEPCARSNCFPAERRALIIETSTTAATD